jgi:hypothetical protein
MADKEKKSKDKSKDSKRRGKGEDKSPDYVSIANHPRAHAQVRAAKGWGGLIGFVVAAALSVQASIPFVQVLERALLFGIVGYLVAWALSMLVWKQLILAEQRAAYEEVERRRAAAAEAEAAEQPKRREPAATAGGNGNPS